MRSEQKRTSTCSQPPPTSHMNTYNPSSHLQPDHSLHLHTGSHFPLLYQFALLLPLSMTFLSPASFPSVNNHAFRSSTLIKTLTSYPPSTTNAFLCSLHNKIPWKKHLNSLSSHPLLHFSFKPTPRGLLCHNFTDTALVKLTSDLPIAKPNDSVLNPPIRSIGHSWFFLFFLKYFLFLASVTLSWFSYLTACPFSVSFTGFSLFAWPLSFGVPLDSVFRSLTFSF